MKYEKLDVKDGETLKLELWPFPTMAYVLKIQPSVLLALMEQDPHPLPITVIGPGDPLRVRAESVYKWLDARRAMLDKRGEAPEVTVISKTHEGVEEIREGGQPCKVQ